MHAIWCVLSAVHRNSGCFKIIFLTKQTKNISWGLPESCSITGLDRPWGFQEVEAPRFQDNQHIKVVRLSALRTGRLYPEEIFLLEAQSTRRAVVRPEGLCQWKIPVTPSGIETATFRLVAQRLNHLRHRVPPKTFKIPFKLYSIIFLVSSNLSSSGNFIYCQNISGNRHITSKTLNMNAKYLSETLPPITIPCVIAQFRYLRWRLYLRNVCHNLSDYTVL
jgi:hypothetical protein